MNLKIADSAYVAQNGNSKSQSETDEILASPKEKNVFDKQFSFLVMWPWKKGLFSVFGAKRPYLGNGKSLSETGLNFRITQRIHVFDLNFSFLVIEKSAESTFLAQKGLISEMVRATANSTTFWDHPRENNIFCK